MERETQPEREAAPDRAPAAPARAPTVRPDVASALTLQRSIGNRATASLLMREYESERSDSTLADAPVELDFDGQRLMMWGAGGVDRSWAAVSGRPNASGGFDYDAARQRQRGEGPIPEGVYWIDPRELANLKDRWFYESRYAGPWGTHRITIHPFTTTETFGRGGFFIHGGSTPGSAGCIDLTSRMADFAAALSSYTGAVKIKLHVRYRSAGVPVPDPVPAEVGATG